MKNKNDNQQLNAPHFYLDGKQQTTTMRFLQELLNDDVNLEGNDIGMSIKLDQVAKEMNESLKEQARQHDVDIEDIRELFEDHKVNNLDELFNDGGDVRCEHFTDLAMEYAFQFGELESDPFMKAQWKAIELAMDTF